MTTQKDKELTQMQLATARAFTADARHRDACNAGLTYGNPVFDAAQRELDAAGHAWDEARKNAQEPQTPAMAPKRGRGTPLLPEHRAAIKCALMANIAKIRPGSMAGLARTHGVSRVTLYSLQRELMAENRDARKKAKGVQS